MDRSYARNRARCDWKSEGDASVHGCIVRDLCIF